MSATSGDVPVSGVRGGASVEQAKRASEPRISARLIAAIVNDFET